MSGRFGLHFTPKHMFNLRTSNIYFSWLSNHIWKLEGMLPEIVNLLVMFEVLWKPDTLLYKMLLYTLNELIHTSFKLL